MHGIVDIGFTMAVYAINMKGDVVSRKDYNMLVAALADAYKKVSAHPLLTDEEMRGRQMGVCTAMACVAEVLAEENARFDKNRFVHTFWKLATPEALDADQARIDKMVADGTFPF